MNGKTKWKLLQQLVHSEVVGSRIWVRSVDRPL